MNARVPAPPEHGGYDPALAALAAALLAAGEALVRASNALAEVEARNRSSRPRPPAHRPSSPLRVEERLSSKQLGAIRAAARRAGLSRDGLAELLKQTVGQEEPAQLSRRDASTVLDKLSAMTGYAR